MNKSTTTTLVKMVSWISILTLVFCEVGSNGDETVGHIYDYIIVGAGPAGLQLAHHLQRAGRDYVVLEQNSVAGSFFLTYPRHEKLISINKRNTGQKNKEYNLRHDWNSLLSDDESLLVKHYSRDLFPHRSAMVHYLHDYSTKLGLNIQYDTKVSNVRRVFNEALYRYLFHFDDQHGKLYLANTLVIATGLPTPKVVNFLGANLTYQYSNMPLDLEHYEAKTVLMLGRGNSAFEVAESIYGNTNFIHMLGRSRIRLAWATHYVGDLRAVNNGLLDTYQLKSLDGIVEGDASVLELTEHDGRIRVNSNRDQQHSDKTLTSNSRGQYVHHDNSALREEYDYVISCLGFRFDWEIFKDYRKNRKYPTHDHGYESSHMPGLFFAGTNSHALDRRKPSEC